MNRFYNSDNSKPPIVGTVFINQLKYNPILERISPSCEGCGQTYSYHIHTKKFPALKNKVLELLLSREKIYYISCPTCTFVMQLDYAEYKELKKISGRNREDGRF